MKRSETIGELAKALAAAQAEYPPIPKSHTGKIMGQGKNGPYEYSYHYADLVDTVDACRPINAAHGLSVSQAPEYVDGQDALTTVLMHESGEWQESTRRLHAAKDDPQGAGSAITYARRYDYCAVLGIVADEDDDGNAATQASQNAPTVRREPPQSRSTAPSGSTGSLISDAQLKLVHVLFGKKGVADDREIRHAYAKLAVGHDFESTKDLTKADASKLIDALNAESEPDYAQDEEPF